VKEGLALSGDEEFSKFLPSHPPKLISRTLRLRSDQSIIALGDPSFLSDH